MAEAAVYGLLAEFATPEALLGAARRMREAGYRRIEAYSPFPVEGLAEILEFHDRRVLKLGLFGGLFGTGFAFAMQLFTNWDYPINVGGRPLYPIPAFLVVVFELTVLFAVLAAVFGMLALNGLPRLHHPIFNARRFALVSEDRFFLCLRSDDPQFAAARTRAALRRSGARHVETVAA
jgi:hypothetical protein